MGVLQALQRRHQLRRVGAIGVVGIDFGVGGDAARGTGELRGLLRVEFAMAGQRQNLVSEGVAKLSKLKKEIVRLPLPAFQILRY